jgi:hypothetical protein
VNGDGDDRAREKPVDVQLFRLRTFEEAWIEILQPASTSLRESRAGVELRAVLTAEAIRWLEMGQANGYFATNAYTELIRPGDVEEHNFFRDSPPPDQATFAGMLTAAQEDLTAPRIRFLELFVFADEHYWRSALDELHDLARDLARGGRLHVDPEAVERIAWTLHGAEPADAAVGDNRFLTDERIADSSFPAAWRIDLPERDPTGLLPAQRLARRLTELEEERRPIITMIEAILTRDEHVDLRPPRRRPRSLLRLLAKIRTLLRPTTRRTIPLEPQTRDPRRETLSGDL